MRWILGLAASGLAAVGLAACASASLRSESFVIATSAGSTAAPSRGVIAAGAAGRAVLLEGGTAPAPWEVVAELDPAARAKLFDLPKLLSALEGDAEDRLPVYVGLKADDSPKEEAALRAALDEAGCQAQTVAGDVVTGLLDARRVGQLARLSWVKSISPAGKVQLRSESSD